MISENKANKLYSARIYVYFVDYGTIIQTLHFHVSFMLTFTFGCKSQTCGLPRLCYANGVKMAGVSVLAASELINNFLLKW